MSKGNGSADTLEEVPTIPVATPKGILVWDIETTPNAATIWRAGRKINVPAANIFQECQICVIGYKWLDQKRAHSLCWEGQDDGLIIRKFIPILERARFSVAHFGRGFDERFLRGRAMYHGIPMSPCHIMADTYRLFRRYTLLNSYKLDYLGELFGLGRKIPTNYGMWQRILFEDHQPSLEKMARYCRRDVQLLAKLYERCRAWFPAVDSVSQSVIDCPHCGGPTIVSKHRLTAQHGPRVQILCKTPGCGQYHTVSETRYEKAKRDARAL
jgi:hypothetical protein